MVATLLSPYFFAINVELNMLVMICKYPISTVELIIITVTNWLSQLCVEPNLYECQALTICSGPILYYVIRNIRTDEANAYKNRIYTFLNYCFAFQITAYGMFESNIFMLVQIYMYIQQRLLNGKWQCQAIAAMEDAVC